MCTFSREVSLPLIQDSQRSSAGFPSVIVFKANYSTKSFTTNVEALTSASILSTGGFTFPETFCEVKIQFHVACKRQPRNMCSMIGICCEASYFWKSRLRQAKCLVRMSAAGQRLHSSALPSCCGLNTAEGGKLFPSKGLCLSEGLLQFITWQRRHHIYL